MTPTGHIIWIIAMAFMTIVVLTVGTLAAAGIIGRSSDDSSGAETRQAGEREEDSAAQQDQARAAREVGDVEPAGHVRG